MQSLIAWPKAELKGVMRGPKPRPNKVREVKSRAPAAAQRNYVAGAPQFNSGRRIIIKHREWLQSIVGVAAFSGDGRYTIQPGLVDDFPWLAQIASSFENYKFRYLRYVYRNKTGTSTAGNVYMAAQYDVNDSPFASREELMNYEGAREEVVWRDSSYDMSLNKGRLVRQFMVRTDALPSGVDAVPYDAAKWTICAVAPASVGVELGDLLVEYEVELINPKMNPAIVGTLGFSASNIEANFANIAIAPLAGMNDPSHIIYSNFPSNSQPTIIDDTKSTPTINFPIPGTYSVRLNMTDGGGTQNIHVDSAGIFNSTGSTGLNWTESFKSTLTAAGQGIAGIAEVVTFAENAKLKMNALIATAGTAVENVGLVLNIVCESTQWVLGYIGLGPTPPMLTDEASLSAMRQRYKKFNLCGFEKMIERVRKEKEMDRYMLDRKRRLLSQAVVSSEEVPAEQPAVENSDSDFEGVESLKEQLLAVALDKRSKSSERKERKARKTAEKPA